MMPLQNELDVAIQVARDAGALLLQYRTRALTVDLKTSVSDPVSEADRDAEQLIVTALEAAFPLDGLLGEEGVNKDPGAQRVWVIDPLDGTVNYLYGRDEWAVSIALEIAGEPVLGVVYQPTIDRLFHAVAGGPAYLNGGEIHVRESELFAACLIATGFSYDSELRAVQARELSELLPLVRDIRRCGSAALDLCAVAGGQVDVSYEKFIRRWDISAGIAIVRAAGGTVVDELSLPGFHRISAGSAPMRSELDSHLAW